MSYYSKSKFYLWKLNIYLVELDFLLTTQSSQLNLSWVFRTNDILKSQFFGEILPCNVDDGKLPRLIYCFHGIFATSCSGYAIIIGIIMSKIYYYKPKNKITFYFESNSCEFWCSLRAFGHPAMDNLMPWNWHIYWGQRELLRRAGIIKVALLHIRRSEYPPQSQTGLAAEKVSET